MAKATKVTDQMFVAASQVGGGNVQSYLLAGFLSSGQAAGSNLCKRLRLRSPGILVVWGCQLGLAHFGCGPSATCPTNA